MKRQFIRISLIVGLVAVGSIASMGQSLDLPESVLASLEQGWTGSGAIVSSDGYIITNNHVVEGATTIEVVLASGQIYEATVIEAKPELDLALIKANATGLPCIRIDADREMRQGYSVVSIGSPKGLVGTMSTGIITALNRDALDLRGLYQINADIAPGSSGGPLIDEFGNLIGINVAVAQEGGTSLTAFGFAIPIGQAEDLLGHVRSLPARRATTLAVPDIAELCSPATVLIVCEKDVLLLDLLPPPGSLAQSPLFYMYPGTTFSGKVYYSSWFASLPQTWQERLLESLEYSLNPVVALLHGNRNYGAYVGECLGRAWRQERKWVLEQGNSSLLGPPWDATCFPGFTDWYRVTVIECSSLAHAQSITRSEQQREMSDLQLVSQATYDVGGREVTSEIGYAGDGIGVEATLKGIMILPTESFVLMTTVTVRDFCDYSGSSSPPYQLQTVFDSHSIQDDCLVRVGEHTGTVVCIDAFKAELECRIPH